MNPYPFGPDATGLVIGLVFTLLVWAVGLLVAYWVIRTAVAAGIRTAVRRGDLPSGRPLGAPREPDVR